MTLGRKLVPLIIAGALGIPAYAAQGGQAGVAAAGPAARPVIEAGQQEAAEAIDARSLLDGMASKLAAARQFSVSIDMRYDVVQASGQKIQFGEVRRVQISRPDHLRIDSRQSDGDAGGLLFDGTTLTMFSSSENVYSQTPHAGDVDAAVRHAVARLGIRVPLARMLTSTFAQDLKKLNTTVDYVEYDVLGPVPADHIAAQTSDVDYQVWIGGDMLPTRLLLTYKNAPGQPQFQADFSSWDLSSGIGDSTFRFVPAEGAERIPILLPAARQDGVDKAQGDAS